MSPTGDYYDLLGVARDASSDEIKRAYRRRARESHPDIAEDDGAEERFKQVSEAYETLSDPDRRAMYDRYGSAGPRGYGDPFGGAAGVDDLFSVFFGGGFGAASRQPAQRVEGRDLAAQVAVTLEEAATGAEKELSYARDAECATCKGTGAAEGGTAITCPDCGGSGQRVTTRQTFLGTMRTAVPCERCGATGMTVEPPCPTCGGSGRTARRETVTVRVPVGAEDGATIRVPRMGEAGVRGAAPGDLLVSIRILPHATLHRQGDDLHMRVAVPLTTAVLGGHVVVPGLGDPVPVEIPAGSKAGDTVKLKSHGMPRPDGRHGLLGTKLAGDLYVHLDIDVPKKLTRAQRKLVKELSESLDISDRLEAEPVRDWLR